MNKASKKAFLEAVLTVVKSMTQQRYQYDPCGKSWFEFEIKDEHDAVLDDPELKKALIKLAETTNYQGKGKTNLEGICEAFNLEEPEPVVIEKSGGYQYGSLKLFKVEGHHGTDHVSAVSPEDAKQVIVDAYLDGYTQEEIDEETKGMKIELVDPMALVSICGYCGILDERYAFQWATVERNSKIILSTNI